MSDQNEFRIPFKELQFDFSKVIKQGLVMQFTAEQLFGPPPGWKPPPLTRKQRLRLWRQKPGVLTRSCRRKVRDWIDPDGLAEHECDW